MALVYTRDWSTVHQLADGTTATIRLVLPEDKPLFQRAAGEFSLDTMSRRFFTPKPRFSESELKYLTEVDGNDHFAIVGVRPENDGWQGLAAARFIRNPSDQESAEFAVVVGDPWQGCGLGTALMKSLCRAAQERGIAKFQGDILATNSAAFRLIDRLVPSADWLTDGIVAMVEFEIADVSMTRD